MALLDLMVINYSIRGHHPANSTLSRKKTSSPAPSPVAVYKKKRSAAKPSPGRKGSIQAVGGDERRRDRGRGVEGTHLILFFLCVLLSPLLDSVVAALPGSPALFGSYLLKMISWFPFL